MSRNQNGISSRFSSWNWSQNCLDWIPSLPSVLLLLRYHLLQIAVLWGKHLSERRFGLPFDLAPFVDDVAQPGARFNGKKIAQKWLKFVQTTHFSQVRQCRKSWAKIIEPESQDDFLVLRSNAGPRISKMWHKCNKNSQKTDINVTSIESSPCSSAVSTSTSEAVPLAAAEEIPSLPWADRRGHPPSPPSPPTPWCPPRSCSSLKLLLLFDYSINFNHGKKNTASTLCGDRN